MNASILGIGPVSALGCGVASLLEGLEGARRPSIETREIAMPGGPVRMPVYTVRAEGLERFLPKRALRRMDSFVSMALLSAFLAVEDAGIVFPDPERVGLVFGTGYGPLRTSFAFQDSLIDFGDKCASPTHFANSVHNALASQVSISMGIQGPTHTVTAFEQTTAGALLTAMLWLKEDAVDYVLAGVGDEFCPVRGYALTRHLAAVGTRRAGDIEGAIRPLDFDVCSYVPGEGFVTLLLGKAESEGARAPIKLTPSSISSTQSISSVSSTLSTPSTPSTAHPSTRIERLVMGRGALEGEEQRIASLDAVVAAANGNSAEGAVYRRHLRGSKKVAAYAALYGGMPTGDGFDLAIAALSLREGKFFGIKGISAAETEPLSGKARIGCLKCAADGFGSLAVLSR